MHTRREWLKDAPEHKPNSKIVRRGTRCECHEKQRISASCRHYSECIEEIDRYAEMNTTQLRGPAHAEDTT
jgi:hypothetical protein